MGPGVLPEKCGVTYDWTSTTEVSGRKMGLPLFGGDNTGGRIGIYRGICPEEAEYSRTVHCDATDSRPLYGGSTVDGDTGLKNVVGTGR